MVQNANLTKICYKIVNSCLAKKLWIIERKTNSKQDSATAVKDSTQNIEK